MCEEAADGQPVGHVGENTTRPASMKHREVCVESQEALCGHWCVEKGGLTVRPSRG